MDKLFKDNNSKFCLIIAVVCLCLQLKNEQYKFILLFSAFLVLSAFFTANACRCLTFGLMGAFSITYLTTSINNNTVITEGLDNIPSDTDFMECYPVGEKDAKYIEENYDVAVDPNGTIVITDTTEQDQYDDGSACDNYCSNQTGSDGNKLEAGSQEYIKCVNNCKHPNLKVLFERMVNKILNSPILGFIIGAASAYLIYMVGKRVWDSSIKNCINRPQV